MQLKYQNVTGDAEVTGAAGVEEHFYLNSVSPEMLAVQKLLAEIAPTDIPVLLQGESGVGKEIVALQIHETSRRRQAAFVKLSCAAFTPETFRAKLSSLDCANGERSETLAGTLFFDEICELDENCQRHLLLSFPDQNGLTIHATLGGRVISCTTSDLESRVHEGHFRSELFYRLNGVCLTVPPLRRRKEDIPRLAEHFLAKYAARFQRAPRTLGDSTMKLFSEHSWPGNIRELENTIKKIVALDSEELGVSDLRFRPMECRAPEIIHGSRSLKATSRAASRLAERELILQTLERTHWNRKRAAAALQISYKALLYKLKQIQVPGAGEV